MTKRNIGWALVCIGLFMLFKMMRITSFGFYSIGRVNTSAIVLVLLILSAIAVVVKKNKFTIGCLIASLVVFVLALMLGTEIYFSYVSLIDVLLVFVPIVLGAGLIIKCALEKVGHKKD
ncbi:hypothetical protein SAMN02745247_00095 [Butyrivibrio hungatei DSM 14810]|uniref:Uncharacterized protein n=1 Tax=Butyrivibrio hungatei DSM 14810 TaxID=1121132 RepID=A0A1M7RR74_9FIRM|nr:hypothetical protein [Butyrivibrio hungatei]SHN48592.1 hypothetical protein SAMN02745247_00095 [Butyrivibrio hungatei DSM 14810]